MLTDLIDEYADPVSVALLTFSTFGLWWSTARMNHLEKVKMTEALSHDNDNMTDVALTIERDRHAENLHKIKQIRNRKHR
jgi:hypothetical protein